MAEALGVDAAFLLRLTSPRLSGERASLPMTSNGLFSVPQGQMTALQSRRKVPRELVKLGAADRSTVTELQGTSGTRRAFFLGTSGATLVDLAQKWESSIALTPEEDSVYAAMRIIEPQFERLVFTGEGENTTVLIKLRDTPGRLPLGSLGDGTKRLLAQAIFLVQAQGGVLLIDEIDTGLHYSTMESMWRFIIEASRRLDVQVFATTHSGDCIRALAWLQAQQPELAQAVSVHRIDKDASSAVRYSAEDIQIAARHHVEVRG
jgi:predicted ATPase